MGGAIALDTPLSGLGGVTPAFSAALGKGLGLSTVGDLIRHYPRRYEDRSHVRKIQTIRLGEAVTVTGKVAGVENVPTRSRTTLTKVFIEDGSGTAALVFFNQWFLKRTFDRLHGRTVYAFGKATFAGRHAVELSDVEWELADDDKDVLSANRIVPVYPLSEGITQSRLRRLVFQAVDAAAVNDICPAPIRRERGLLSSAEAFREVHFPADEGRKMAAERRLIFDQFLVLQLAVALRAQRLAQTKGIAFQRAGQAVDELREALPFHLTDAQTRVITEVAADMAADRVMNRLVQGDVGSGKTVVALAAILIAVRNGAQAALMAPTEILAEQHYLGVKRLFERLNVTCALLAGGLTAKERRDALAAVESGKAQVIVGTHAIIQSDVRFQRLGLVVVDEQHRFGVMQRSALQSKGEAPDTLVMTATPIPRTLTLTVYGDLAVSVIDQLPPGRKPIRTHWKRSKDREQVYATLRNLLREGRQAYIVCSLVDESEKLQARAASELAAHLQAHVFAEFVVGLLHGQMKSSEKDAVMERFQNREISVLVATTVIEVGVDVPNASVILIEDADRFGMSQLHQLRGRVGRGETQSYCLLIADAKGDVAQARLETLVRTTDGFEIAEEDLKLRGPGEFYGTRQSGLDSLPFVDVIRDVPILKEAREVAFSLIDRDPQLVMPEHAALRKEVSDRYKELATLAN